MFYHLQELFRIIHEIQLDLYMIPHQFLPLFSSRIRQFNQKIIVIITNKLLVNTMILLIIQFFHHLIQIFKQTILKIFPNLIIIKGHNTHTHIYYKQFSHKVTFLYKIKEYLIQTLYNLLKEDPKILHFRICLLTLYIK